MKIIQRLGSEYQYSDSYINGLLRLKKKYPNSFNDVWLATDYGFPKLEVHEKHAKALVAIAEKFRAAGVGVSLQLSNSIGHGQYMSSEDCTGLVYKGSPVQPMVGPDGTVAHYCFCFRSEALTDYVTKELSYYCKAVHPEYVWVDDDFRASNHAPVEFSCFCDGCIEKFNKELNASYTREELAEELIHGDIGVREKFIEFNRHALGVLAEKMAKAVHEVSPETTLAFQSCFHGYTGGDDDFFFDSVKPYGAKAPAYRGGGGVYNDHDPNLLFYKVTEVAYQNAFLPDYVTLRVPEIENLPFAYSGKSPAGDMLESTLQLAAGHTGLSYSMIMRFTERPDYYGKHLALIEKMYPYFEKLADVSAKTKEGGLFYATSRKNHLKPLGKEEGFPQIAKPVLHTADPMMRDGVPVSFEDNGGAVLLTCENAAALTDEELKAMLSRSVITEGGAIDVIQSRGFDLGIETRIIDADTAGRYYESFTKDPLNPANKRHLTVSFFVPGGNKPRYTFDKIPAGARVLGNYKTDVVSVIDKEPTVANFIFKTKEGGTFAVFGYGLFVGILPKYGVDRFLRIADGICEKKLPAVLMSESQAFLYPRVDKDGKTVSVSVANATLGEDKIRIALRNPAGRKFIYMSQYGKTRELTAKEKDGEFIFDLPALPAYSVGTVFCE